MPSFRTELEQPYKLFTAVGFGVEKPAVDALSQVREATYSAHAKTTIQLGDNGQQVDVASGKKTESFSYSPATKSIGFSEKGISYDVYANGNQADASHVKLSSPLLGDKQSFDIQSDGKHISGTCDTQDNITTCTQEIKDAQGNLLLRGMSTSDIYKNPNKFSQVTEYTDAAGKKLGKISEAVEYDSKKGTITVDSTTTK